MRNPFKKIFLSDPSPLSYGTRTSGNVTNYRSSQLTYDQIEAMRLHPIVKFCMQFLKMPIARVPINIQCDDEEMAAVLNAIYEPVLNDYLRQAAQALDYGFWPAEVRWERRPVQYKIDNEIKVRNCIALKTFKGLKQQYSKILEDGSGSFLGLEYTYGNRVKLLANENKCLLVTNRYEQGDRYGISELYAAKKAWDRQSQIENFAVRYYETKSDPIPVVRYDDINSYMSGDSRVDAKQTAYDMGVYARQGRPIALPAKTDEKGNFLWDMKYLEASDRSPLFRNAMEYHDVQMMRALLVPERSLTQSEATGSYSMAEAHGSFLVERQEEIIDMLIEALNLYSLPKVIQYNFGNTSYSARFVSGGLRETDKALTNQIVSALMASGNITPEQAEWIEKRTGIPYEIKAKPEAPAMSECSCKVELAEKRYYRQLQPWERKVQLTALDGYFNTWLVRSNSALVSVYQRQADAYYKAVEKILYDKTSVSQRLDAVRKVELQYQAQYKDTLYNSLYELCNTAAMYACNEEGIKYTGLDAPAMGWVRAQADNVWYKHDGDIRARAGIEAITGISAGLPDKTILYNIKNAFTEVLGDETSGKIHQSLLILSGEAINRGREVAMRLYNLSGDDPIVAVIRSELLDGSACRYCRDVMDMKIIDIDNPDYNEYFVLMPHFGCRGININIRKSENADYRSDKKYQWKRPTEAQFTNWTKE